MPNVFSIALGGGSVVKGQEDGTITVGPESVAQNLSKEARCFGGSVITTTCVSVASGKELGGNFQTHEKVSSIGKAIISATQKVVKAMLGDLVDQVRMSEEDLAVILVGGGTVIIPRDQNGNVQLPGCTNVIVPDDSDVANAVGSAIAQVSGRVDTMISKPQAEALAEALKIAKERAMIAGADPDTIRPLSKSCLPIPYMPGTNNRVQVTVVGDLKEDAQPKIRDLKDDDDDDDDDDDKDYVPEKEVRVNKVNPSEGASVANKGTTTIRRDEKKWSLPRILSEVDIENISIGCNFLGTGGGGDVYLAAVEAKSIINDSKQNIQVISVDDLKDEDMVVPVAYIGAPTVLIERLPTGTETVEAVRKLEALCGKKATAILPCEIGGFNGVAALTAAAKLGLPVVDADGMGRAFPKISCYLPFIREGNPLTPMVMMDHHGRAEICLKADKAEAIDEKFRNVLGKMGMAAGMALPPIAVSKVRSDCVLKSFTVAHKMGLIIRRARAENRDPIPALLGSKMPCKLLYEGKIVKVIRDTSNGFTIGRVEIAPLTNPGDKKISSAEISLYFINENMAVFKKGNQIPIATVPDLITVALTDTGEPVATERLSFGLRVSILAFPPHPHYRNSYALTKVGPQIAPIPELQNVTYKSLFDERDTLSE